MNELMVRYIPLTKGRRAVVDFDNYEWLSRLPWYYQSSGYACRKNEAGATYMHRLIMKAKPGEIVDHINGDKLDNRRSNLRLVSPSQNTRNSKAKGATFKYKGVYWESQTKKWRSIIKVSGKRISLGRFSDEIEAARAYDRATREYFGEHGRYNFSRLTNEELAVRPAAATVEPPQQAK